MGRHGGRPSLKMNKLTVAEVGQISELPAENSALALRVSLVRTAASEIRRYLPNLPTIALERDSTDKYGSVPQSPTLCPPSAFHHQFPESGHKSGWRGNNRWVRVLNIET